MNHSTSHSDTNWSASPRLLWTAAAAYTPLLTYLLLAPHPLWFLGDDDNGVATEEIIDQTVSGYAQHGLTYAVLGFILVKAAATGTGPRAGVCALLAMFHGATAECLQYFIPHRYFDGYDALANAAGVLVGWCVAHWSFCCSCNSIKRPSGSRR